MNLIWSEGALSDWNDVARYIAVRFGRNAFDEFNEATTQAERQIKQFPMSGTLQKTRKHKNLNLRFVLIQRLSKMVYHVQGDTIIIDVIWDTRQDPKRLSQRLSKM